MEEKPKIVKPEALPMKKWHSILDPWCPEWTITTIKNIEGIGSIGLGFGPPGAMTNVFSMEYEDDGTAEQYFGPCHEFYYMICGECAMYWGKDASEIRSEKSDKVVLKAGEVGYWPPGWKYAPKNTGNVPLTWFWIISKPPKGTVTRY